MPKFKVGPGVLQTMQKQNPPDVPVSDEIYFPEGAAAKQWSETQGESGRTYKYVFATNKVVVFPPS